MGTFKPPWSKSFSDKPLFSPPMPDPRRFTVLERENYGRFSAIRVRYEGCTTFEGEKILVTVDLPPAPEVLDPHFYEDGPVVARFMPGDEGWKSAMSHAMNLMILSRHPSN